MAELASHVAFTSYKRKEIREVSCRVGRGQEKLLGQEKGSPPGDRCSSGAKRSLTITNACILNIY